MKFKIMDRHNAIGFAKISIFLFSLLLNLPLWGQLKPADLIPFSIDGQWGYMNTKKEVVIPPEYDEAYFFQTKKMIARVKKKGKYGLIDQNNKIILPIKYDSIARRGILTLEGVYWHIIHENEDLYVSADGVILRELIAHRSWVCELPDTWKCKELTLITDFENINGKAIKYKYKERSIVEINGKLTDMVDTVYVQLDSIIAIKLSDAKILYRDDHKINICREFVKNGRVRFNLCLGFKYDEVKFEDCLKWESPNLYDPVIKVRSGIHWGMIDLSALESKGIRLDYKQSWEYVPTRYLQIEEDQNGYYLVEYARNKFGYIKPTGDGKVIEYWLNE